MELKIISAENGENGHYVLVPKVYEDVITRMCVEGIFIRVDIIQKDEFLVIGSFHNRLYAEAQKIRILRAIKAQHDLDQKKGHTMSKKQAPCHATPSLSNTTQFIGGGFVIILAFPCFYFATNGYRVIPTVVIIVCAVTICIILIADVWKTNPLK